jgi:transcriptional regulator GlxA family with amidase domain
MRLDRATRLLESSGATIKAVAQRCGFGSEEIMRRAFQRRFGVPPLDYRARFR